MNKKIILIVGVLIIVAVALVIFISNNKNNVSSTATTTPVIETNNPPAVDLNQIKLEFPGQTLPLSNDSKTLAWAVFSKYLGYNKDGNLEGVKSIVYKVASVCNDPKTIIDCKARMSLAYQYGSALKKEDFINVWSDQKQIILSTDFWLESSKDLDQYGRFRSVIFFIKGADGEWKLLSFSPTQGGATNKGTASQKEVDDRLVIYTEDGDQDGVADYHEQCLDKSGDLTCVKTDPKLRDTNGNGLWDGAEALMNSMK